MAISIVLSWLQGRALVVSNSMPFNFIVAIAKNFHCQNWFRIRITYQTTPTIDRWADYASSGRRGWKGCSCLSRHQSINSSMHALARQSCLHSFIHFKCQKSSILFYPSLTQFKSNYLIQFQLTDGNLSSHPPPFSAPFGEYFISFRQFGRKLLSFFDASKFFKFSTHF